MRYHIEMFGGVSEWFGPAPRRWVRTISRKVIWMKEI